MEKKLPYPKVPLHKILMLVPHEPTLDPRIKWVTQICSQIGETDILGFVWHSSKPLREYDGLIYTERVQSQDYYINYSIWNIYSRIREKTYIWLNSWHGGRRIHTFIRNLRQRISIMRSLVLEHAPQDLKETSIGSLLHLQKSPDVNRNKCSAIGKSSRIKNVFTSIPHAINSLKTLDIISSSLFQRARAASIHPKVIICHDIFALKAGIGLKKLFGSPVIYDSHELWPEADLQALGWEKALTAFMERRLIRQADVVITVTPQIACYLEKLYGIRNVLSVPNAEPFCSAMNKQYDRPISLPVKFLLQGNVAPGRGIEELLESWGHLHDERAVLVLRCPTNPFFDCLQQRFRSMIEGGRIIISQPVAEDELVLAASEADIGIIPYGGPSLNHLYACPNKLSQYMQAGLAILYNSDLEFVSEVIEHYQCGMSYNASDPSTLVDVVQGILNAPEKLRMMRRNSYHAAQSEFNWDIKSIAYSKAIKQLFYEKEAS